MAVPAMGIFNLVFVGIYICSFVIFVNRVLFCKYNVFFITEVRRNSFLEWDRSVV